MSICKQCDEYKESETEDCKPEFCTLDCQVEYEGDAPPSILVIAKAIKDLSPYSQENCEWAKEFDQDVFWIKENNVRYLVKIIGEHVVPCTVG